MHLIVSTNTDLLRVASEKIIYITSDGNYSTIILADGEARLVTYQLGKVEQMIGEQLGRDSLKFIRIGKSHIINTDYVYYINVAKQSLILSDNAGAKYTVSASRDALKSLKDLFESKIK